MTDLDGNPLDETFPKPYIEIKSAEQERSLMEFKERMRAHPDERLRSWGRETADVRDPESSVDQKCLRFLKARKYKVDDAIALAESHVRWLLEYRPDEIRPEVVEAQRRHRSAFWAGQDRYGRPVLYIVMRNHNPKVAPAEETLRYSVYTLRKGIRKRMPRGAHNFVTIFDLTDMSRKNVDFSMGKALTNCLQDNFPERQACSFIINAPWYFRMIWAVVKPWLQKDTVNKIRMLGSDWREELLKFFEPAHLPKQYGGQLDVNMEPMGDHDPLSSEISERDTITADEMQHEIQEMIEEFRAEEAAVGRGGAASSSSPLLGRELDAQ